MKSLRRALIALGVVGFVAGAVPLALALADEGGHQRELIAIVGPVIGWAFIGTGIFAWLRQPENRFGALMTFLGFVACLASLRVATESWIFSAGLVFIALQWGVLYHLLLAFPGGTLRSGLERVLVGLAYFNALGTHLVQVVFHDTSRMGLPDNRLLVEAKPELAADITRGRFWLGLALLAALGVILVRRWLAAAPGSQRQALAPVLVTGGLVMALLGVWYVAILDGWDPDLIEGLEQARYVVLALVPFAFLAGLLRSRVAGATAVTEVVARLGDPSVRSGGVCYALADSLEGTSLDIAYRLPEGGYENAAGERVDLPPTDPDWVAIPLEPGDEPSAVLIHDASRDDERELVRGVGAAAALTLENERLAGELRAKVEELSASRARIVETSDAARRRLERDLHDGAQQRLVSLALSLRLLRSKLDGDADAAEELEAARNELDEALGDLRKLARGIHPSVLSDRGLDAALEGLAGSAPLPVELENTPRERLPAPVESAAYFVVSEALTNVAKYSKATHANISVVRDNGRLVVEVEDDGVGGADPAKGSGLRGLVDRVSALDGDLEVDSRPGLGTTVRATIPCE